MLCVCWGRLWLPLHDPARLHKRHRRMIRAAAFLRWVPVLSGLSDELLDRLTTSARELQVRADDWIIREGEQAESTAHRDQWPPGGH